MEDFPFEIPEWEGADLGAVVALEREIAEARSAGRLHFYEREFKRRAHMLSENDGSLLPGLLKLIDEPQ